MSMNISEQSWTLIKQTINNYWTIETPIQIDTIRSGCKLFKPFEPIVFLELLIHSLTNARSVD